MLNLFLFFCLSLVTAFDTLRTVEPLPAKGSTSGPFGNWQFRCDYSSSVDLPFNAIAEILTNLYEQKVPIVVQVDFESDTLPSNILAYTEPLGWWSLDLNTTEDFPALYISALWSQLKGYRLYPNDADMYITVNPDQPWYWGTDGSPPSDMVDFVTCMLHEIHHGLGMISTWEETSKGFVEYEPGSVYDKGLYYNDEPIDQYNVEEAATGRGDVMWSDFLKLYAPSTWSGSQSFSHTDEDTYLGTADCLVCPILYYGMAVHYPGPLTLDLMESIGWELVPGARDFRAPSRLNPPVILSTVTIIMIVFSCVGGLVLFGILFYLFLTKFNRPRSIEFDRPQLTLSTR